MEYYFAPMEGITGYIQRNAHHSLFPGINKYFTAFIAPGQKGKMSTREKRDIQPEHNRGIYTVPQILTNQAEDFVLTAARLKEEGYREVNLNLGCPSRTVVTKYRGAGFLAVPDQLDRFLREVFASCRDNEKLAGMKISVKTRLGMEEPEEFPRLLEIYNQYPLEELVIHPRTQKDFYSGPVHMDQFLYAARNSTNPVCYNGDITSEEDMEKLHSLCPQISRVMIGRGLLVNPALHIVLQGGNMPDMERIRDYHDRIYQAYIEEMPGPRPVLFKMKELWSYMGRLMGQPEKLLKKIRKAEKLSAYEEAVDRLFRECHIAEH